VTEDHDHDTPGLLKLPEAFRDECRADSLPLEFRVNRYNAWLGGHS